MLDSQGTTLKKQGKDRQWEHDSKKQEKVGQSRRGFKKIKIGQIIRAQLQDT